MSTPAVFSDTDSPDRARTVLFGEQKGGTGRTTTAVNVAHEAARLGARVLLIDFDPNRVLTLSQLGYDPDDDDTITDVVSSGSTGAAGDTILTAPDIWQPRPDLAYENGGAAPDTEGAVAFIPGSPSLGALVENQLAGRPGSERYLARSLSGVAQHFDLVLIDTGAQATRIAWMTMFAAGSVLTVYVPEDPAINGIADEIDLVQECADIFELDTRIIGAVCTKYDSNYADVHSKAILRAKGLLTEYASSGVAALRDMPEPIPGAGAWQTGAVQWPEVIRQRAAIVKYGARRSPLAAGLHVRADASAKFFERKSATAVETALTGYTRLAVRLLQGVAAPCYPAAAAFLAQASPALFTDDPGKRKSS